MKRRLSVVPVIAIVASMLAPSATPASAGPVDIPARSVEPVILQGAQLPDWSRLPAQGAGKGHTYGTQGGQRDAHAGQLVVPPDARPGVPVDQVTAYAWENGRFTEIPVQVDERFPYFLANGNSDFGAYSGTDEELTYAWDVESWKKTAGECFAQYPEGVSAMADPVPTLDDDDEIVFMADDAGAQAPLDAEGPVGSGTRRQEVQLVDPRDPTSQRYVYLFLKASGSTFNETNGYVNYERDANADEWIDRETFLDHDPEKLGTSNTGYGPNLSGTVCTDDPETAEVETLRTVGDRFPRDGVTVSTDTYRFRATGRWMVRGMQITKPGTKAEYGPDLIDRWKGRAFQQSPDSSISVVGFEDEQVNWEANSSLLGELEGPVRAVRETWGADSGTNVTKTETFYRDAITYRYRVRVHPIPPDGLYTSWDYNHDVAATYYNETKTQGVPVDGVNDDIGQVDEGPTGPAFFDAPDPTFTKPLAFFNWEQVSGRGDSGSLVYMFEFKNAQSFENPAVTPYYRDDACLDDGTGDNPSPRAMPGESYEWMEDAAAGHEKPGVQEASREYLARPCYTEAPEGYDGPYRQGCFGCHGIHYFATHDSDNAFGVKPTTEIDGQQWQWAVPTAAPANVGDAYANTVKTPLVPVVGSQASTPAQEPEPEDPEPAATKVEITGATSGQTTDAVTLAARLSDEKGPVIGEELTFTLDGTDLGSATTDEQGVASFETVLEGPARTVELSVTYAGSEERASSSATAPFEILHDDSAMDLSVTRDRSEYLARAVLTESDTAEGLSGRTVEFFLNDSSVGTATTDADGVASIALPRSQAKDGDVVRAVFSGDDHFTASSAEEQISK